MLLLWSWSAQFLALTLKLTTEMSCGCWRLEDISDNTFETNGELRIGRSGYRTFRPVTSSSSTHFLLCSLLRGRSFTNETEVPVFTAQRVQPRVQPLRELH